MTKVTLVILLITGFISLKSQTVPVKTNEHIDYQSRRKFHSNELTPLPNNFNIKFDLKRLAKLHPVEENRDNTYYYPDTVIVYSISQNPKKYTYFYSELGERQMTMIKVMENEVWVNHSFELCTYDSVSNLLTSEIKVWQNDTWVKSGKITNTYTTNHNVLTTLNEFWDGTDWINIDSSTYTYNVSGKIVALLKEVWIDNNWTNDFYDLFTYDEFGNLQSSIRQIWEINTWNNEYQYTYSYDVNNNLLSGVIEKWEIDDWIFFYKENYVYNSSNQPIEYTGQVWNDTDWMNNNKYSYTYNEYGFVEIGLGELWIDGIWVINERAQFTQNFYGGVQSELIEHWLGNSWINYTLSTYSHDEFGNTLSANLYNWDGETWIQNGDGLLEMSYYYNLFNEYFVGYLAEASYISIITNLHETTNENTLKFFASPNPSHGTFTLIIESDEDANAQVTFFNLNGTKVIDLFLGSLTKGENRMEVPALSLPDGIYIAKLSTTSLQKYLKIIILNK